MHVSMAKPSRSKERSRTKDPDLVALGRRVCHLREAAGLTQEALAHKAGLHWTYIGQIERGERNLSFKNVLKLAKGLDVEPGELFDSAG